METTAIANFLFEIGTLRKIVRSHRQRFLTDDLSDNIASHSFRVAIIGHFLACQEKVDILKVVTMCLFHDSPETRSGDLNWIHKKYAKIDEPQIIHDQFQKVGANTITTILTEYNERKTIESQVAKDADNLDQSFLIREYSWTGNKVAAIWESAQTQKTMLFTQSAKELYEALYSVTPNTWATIIDK
jgi:putative hydrolases of HD superfamily